MPPREIMRYVAFKNGEPVAKEGMPMEYRTLFDEYKTMFIEAKKARRSEENGRKCCRQEACDGQIQE